LKASRGIVVAGLVLVGLKLVLLPYRDVVPAELLVLLDNCLLTLLVAAAAWQASNRSRSYARLFWRSIVVVAFLWSVNFGVAAFTAIYGHGPFTGSPGWAVMVINSLPVAAALTVPLLLREDGQKLKMGWLQALDIAQLCFIVFSAFLIFFYIPSLSVSSDAERVRYYNGLHLMRDGFLALGYLYRGSRSASPDLRRLQFRMSGFLVAYGLSAVLAMHADQSWHWSPLLANAITDVPILALLAMAATWRQGEAVPRAEAPGDREGTLWMQMLALVLPVSVVALASYIMGRRLRLAWILVTASFFLYAVRLIVMQRQQKKTLSSLAAMEEKFAKAFRSSPAAIAISRLSDGKLIDGNDRWLELMNLTREEALGRTSIDLGIFENAEQREELVGALRNRRPVRGRNLNFTVDGRLRQTVISADVIDLAGEPLIIASMLDVTDLKNVTQQLQQAQKMELVGSLVGGVAHDFNNLLTVITGYSALALSKGLDPEAVEDIHRINEASGKAAALTRQLLAFSRRQVLQPRNISLNTTVRQIETLLHRTIGENIKLAVSLAPQLGTVHADPVHMEQVVMNLAVNARDAMPRGGTLLFQTQNLDLPVPYPASGFEIPAGRYVLLVVTDTGTGIRPEDLDRIFEPFFTTKAAGSGTGLGLSTVYGIVKQSGGYIWAYSDLGVGTTFKVCLPRVDLPPDPIDLEETALEDLSGSETVLVVDDDARVCELTAKILGQYGYHVITADSEERAEQRAADFAGEIHLLVTDVVMAEGGGRELAQQLKIARPAIRTLYMSGYPHLARAGKTDTNFGESMLLKPFAPIDLARAAKRALNGALSCRESSHV
jgi:PAS domain S-box-containing protein